MPITMKDIEAGRDTLMEALAKPDKTRGIYIPQNGAHYSMGEKLNAEKVARQAEEKRQYDADLASGKIQLDLHGQQIVAPEKFAVNYVNPGDVLGKLVGR